MEEGDDVLEHINKIKTLAEQLDALGAPVNEDDLVITLLASLSESYAFLITALESRADSLSWELVTSRLVHEDLKRKEQGGGIDGAAHSHSQALMTTENGRRKGRQAPIKTNSACHYAVSKGIGSPSAQFEFARMPSDNGHSVRILLSVKMILATICFRLVKLRARPGQVTCGWLTLVRRST